MQMLPYEALLAFRSLFFGISGLAHLEGGILAPGSSPNDGRFDMRRRAKGTVKSHFAADAFFCMYELVHLCLKVIIDNVKKILYMCVRVYEYFVSLYTHKHTIRERRIVGTGILLIFYSFIFLYFFLIMFF